MSKPIRDLGDHFVFQRQSQKCHSQSEAKADHLGLLIGPKNTNVLEDVEIFVHVKFC